MIQNTWVDRHSINCSICDMLIDERTAACIAGGTAFCSAHYKRISRHIYALCSKLREAGEDVYFEYEIGELVDYQGDTIYLDEAMTMLRSSINSDPTLGTLTEKQWLELSAIEC